MFVVRVRPLRNSNTLFDPQRVCRAHPTASTARPRAPTVRIAGPPAPVTGRAHTTPPSDGPHCGYVCPLTA
eukprot:7608649-Pyramimonas_sp.AAC.1